MVSPAWNKSQGDKARVPVALLQHFQEELACRVRRQWEERIVRNERVKAAQKMELTALQNEVQHLLKMKHCGTLLDFLVQASKDLSYNTPHTKHQDYTQQLLIGGGHALNDSQMVVTEKLEHPCHEL